jgi:hypothetical protein
VVPGVRNDYRPDLAPFVSAVINLPATNEQMARVARALEERESTTGSTRLFAPPVPPGREQGTSGAGRRPAHSTPMMRGGRRTASVVVIGALAALRRASRRTALRVPAGGGGVAVCFAARPGHVSGHETDAQHPELIDDPEQMRLVDHRVAKDGPRRDLFHEHAAERFPRMLRETAVDPELVHC